jgi:hypothetical protein
MDKNHITRYQQRKNPNQADNPDTMLSKSGSTLYRMSWKSDRWGCKSCSMTYGKWGMIDHLCRERKNGRNIAEPPSGATGYATGYAVDNKFCKTEKEVMTRDMSQTTELSEEAKAIIQENIEARQQSSKFVKMQPGEKKVFQFVPEKTEQVVADFNGKKALRFRYTVIEEDGDQEKYFEVSKRTSEDIDTFLMEGHTRLKISRSGSGVDTRYLIVPV